MVKQALPGRWPLLRATVLVAMTASPALAAGPPFLVADINPDRQTQVPPRVSEFSIVELGGSLYFKGHDGIHGFELWRTDGTAAGTALVRDICPGICSSNPVDLTRVGDQILFRADDGEHGAELWRSDGSGPGTQLLADLYPGGATSIPRSLTALGSRVVFTAFVPGLGREPWVSDGTVAGTHVLRDILPGPDSEFTEPLGIASGRLFIPANDGVHGRELWATDGTVVGTVQVRDINPGAGSSLLSLADLFGPSATEGPDGALLFGACEPASGCELWRSDGTSAGTYLVADLAAGPDDTAPERFARVGDVVFFATQPGELWRTDGTAAGTSLLRDFAPPDGTASAYYLTAAGDRLFLQVHANTEQGATRTLWTSDGTTAGTTDLRTFPALGDWASILFAYRMTALGGQVLFFSPEEATGVELWHSDGTIAGTARVRDINPGSGSSFLFDLLESGFIVDRPLVFGGQLFFRAFNPQQGVELWRSDGTEAGTALVKDLDTQTSSFGFWASYFDDQFQGQLTRAGETVFFQADDGETGEELWRSDGTAAGTFTLGDLYPGEEGSYPLELTALGVRLVFRANHPDYGTELWRTDGGPSGTALVADLHPGVLSSNPYSLRQVGGLVLFSASTPELGESGVWASDGTSAWLAAPGPERPGDFTELGGSVVFTSEGGLWRLDSGGSLTSLGEESTTPFHLARAADIVLFTANDGVHGRELWRSDGTAEGTSLVEDIAPGPGQGATGPLRPSAEPLPVAKGAAFFQGHDGPTGAELWRSDGTEEGTFRLRDIRPGAAGSEPEEVTPVGDIVFFTAADGVHGRELWVTDGSEAGTSLVVDLLPGPESSLPTTLAAVDGRLFFSAHTPALGREAWTSDGTAAGTVPLADLAPGPLPASPQGFTQAGRYVFFAANDGTTGFELWAVEAQRIFADGFESGDLSAWSAVVE